MKNKNSIFKFFYAFISKHPKKFVILFLLLLLEGLTATLSVLAVVPFTDFLIDPTLSAPSRVTVYLNNFLRIMDIPSNFWVFGFIFIIINLIKGLLEVTIRYSSLSVVFVLLGGLISDLIEEIYSASWYFFSEVGPGQLGNTIIKELTNISDAFLAVTSLLARCVQLVTYLSIPLFLDPIMTFTALGLSILFSLPFVFIRNLNYTLGTRNTTLGNIYISTIVETLAASRLIIGFGRQQAAKNRIMFDFNNVASSALLSNTLTTSVSKIFQPFVILASVIAMGFAIQRGVIISELTAVMWSLLAATPILTGILHGSIGITNLLPSFEQLINIKQKAAALKELEGKFLFSKLKIGIEFKNVNFNYPNNKNSLQNINLFVKKGSMVALVGESGSGKSTITDLILGLLVPTQGELFLDNIPLKEWSLNSYRNRVGYVPQDPLLFNLSIRDNLLWSFTTTSDSEIRNALKLANALEFVEKMPAGLDTYVGDRGVRLSGGQRQRIALARALIRQPELLILDEATSSLDSESERLIQQSIESISKKTTILVVAHRLSTISNSDFVYVLNLGKIVESGSFNQLKSQQGGVLNKMIEAQALM
jgi:ATP-binding cassette subfamily B protein